MLLHLERRGFRHAGERWEVEREIQDGWIDDGEDDDRREHEHETEECVRDIPLAVHDRTDIIPVQGDLYAGPRDHDDGERGSQPDHVFVKIIEERGEIP